MASPKKGSTSKKPSAAAKAPKQIQPVRMYEGKKVTPTLFDGTSVKQGKFIAATVEGQLVYNKNGRPYCFRDLGQLVKN
jgi:hypothetical protein